MNDALFRVMMKLTTPMITKLSTGIILYEGLLTWVYPVISENLAITKVVEAIPTAVKSVFGVSEEDKTDSFEAFITAQFLARIWAVFMVLYNVETAHELLTKMIEDGFLAFPLSTPVPRNEFLTTQALVLINGNAILVFFTLLGLFGGTSLFGISIDRWRYFRFGFLSFTFYSLVGAYSLFFASCFTEEDIALSLAVGLTLTFYAMDVAGGLNDKLSWLRKLSLFQCYQPQKVLEGTTDPTKTILGLISGTLILLGLGIITFNETNLAI